MCLKSSKQNLIHEIVQCGERLCPTQGTSEHRCGKTEVKIDLPDTGGADSVTWSSCPLGQLGPFRRGFRGHSPVAKLMLLRK